MGRKRKFSKILLFAAMLSTIGAGVFGSIPLPVRAAEEEETYTVRFEAYEGACETESVTVPKGESIILPDASYEGHCLESWMDVTESGNVHTFKAVGAAGSEYTPERDLWLYANWKPDQDQEPGQDAVSYGGVEGTADLHLRAETDFQNIDIIFQKSVFLRIGPTVLLGAESGGDILADMGDHGGYVPVPCNLRHDLHRIEGIADEMWVYLGHQGLDAELVLLFLLFLLPGHQPLDVVRHLEEAFVQYVELLDIPRMQHGLGRVQARGGKTLQPVAELIQGGGKPTDGQSHAQAHGSQAADEDRDDEDGHTVHVPHVFAGGILVDDGPVVDAQSLRDDLIFRFAQGLLVGEAGIGPDGAIQLPAEHIGVAAGDDLAVLPHDVDGVEALFQMQERLMDDAFVQADQDIVPLASVQERPAEIDHLAQPERGSTGIGIGYKFMHIRHAVIFFAVEDIVIEPGGKDIVAAVMDGKAPYRGTDDGGIAAEEPDHLIVQELVEQVADADQGLGIGEAGASDVRHAAAGEGGGYVDEGSVHFVFLVLQFHVGLDEGGQGIVHVLLGQLPGDQRDH